MEELGLFKKTMLAGLGAYSVTRDKAQAMVNELIQKGELSKEEGAKFVKAMMDKADEEMEYMRDVVDKRVEAALSKIKPSYDEEFKKINQKLDKLTKEVEKLSK